MTDLLEFKLADLDQARVLMRERWGPMQDWYPNYHAVYELASALEIKLAVEVMPPYVVDLDAVKSGTPIAMFSWVRSAVDERKRVSA